MNLLDFRRNETSQYGEDGILEKIFAVLGVERGRCVEFGAWDGKLHSNSYHLISSKRWSGVLIEGNPVKFADLQKTFADRPDVVCLGKLVGFEPPMLLDDYLSATELPLDFDLLSIDIDGNDYHVLDSIRKYKPKVIVIEFNPTVPNHIDFVQERNLRVNHGSSVSAIVKLANSKGYELACCTDCNAILVDRKHFPKLGIEDNTLANLRRGVSYHTYLIQCFDGTLQVAGKTKLIWHNVEIDNARIQMLPKELRTFGDSIK
jgi:hypothetical protein